MRQCSVLTGIFWRRGAEEMELLVLSVRIISWLFDGQPMAGLRPFGLLTLLNRCQHGIEGFRTLLFCEETRWSGLVELKTRRRLQFISILLMFLTAVRDLEMVATYMSLTLKLSTGLFVRLLGNSVVLEWS